MVLDRVLDFHAFREHKDVELTALHGRGGILIAGVGVLHLETVDGNIRLPMSFQRRPPAQLRPVVVTGAGELLEHRRHVAADQAVADVEHPERFFRWRERGGVERRECFWFEASFPAAGCEQCGQCAGEGPLEHGHGQG